MQKADTLHLFDEIDLLVESEYSGGLNIEGMDVEFSDVDYEDSEEPGDYTPPLAIEEEGMLDLEEDVALDKKKKKKK
ncbi:hypothetical protein EON65_53625 [archaeon]|nr:MAG: hypothetical protein EON65_53625 [archaeon]